MTSRTVIQGLAANSNIPLVRSFFQFDHLSTEYIFQVVSDLRSAMTMENRMKNFLGWGELFELDEWNPDITNATGMSALYVHVSPSSKPDLNVCSN
jgi:hypothetical protein